MATIDTYKHKLLDFFVCPSDYDLVYKNTTREIAIYQLEEDIPTDEMDFDGKKDDLIIGGGSGEVESLRISKKAIKFFLDDDFDDFQEYDELVKSFWSSSFAYRLGSGLIKLGWTPDKNMEFWFANKIVNQLKMNKKVSS